MDTVTTDKLSIPVLTCARAAHEANRAYCVAIGDHSQVAWDDAPAWQQKSAIDGVVGVLAGNTPEQSHESWMQHKKVDGWTYGPVKDPEKKQHPCMVPYAELPDAQRQKDHIFVGVVWSVARSMGVENLHSLDVPGGQTQAVLREILKERHHQILKWGGPDGDDNNSGADWAGFIIDRAAVLQDDYDSGDITIGAARRLILEIAALAAAWLESHDRKAGA